MKIYKYKDKYYAEEDKSIEFGEQGKEWGGDLFDLYWALKENGHASESTFYYDEDGNCYDDEEELIEKAFGYLLDEEAADGEE